MYTMFSVITLLFLFCDTKSLKALWFCSLLSLFGFINVYAIVYASLINNFNNFNNVFIIFYVVLFLCSLLNFFKMYKYVLYIFFYIFLLTLLSNCGSYSFWGSSIFFNPLVNFNHYVTKLSNILNNNLLNGLLLIHPPLLYISYVYLFLACWVAIITKFQNTQFFEYQRIKTRKDLLILFLFLLNAAFLGSWWAYQELNWGGWWNWDFIEIIIFFLLWFFIVWIHRVDNFLHIVSTLLCMFFFYWTVRLNYINSIHNFISESLTFKFVIYTYIITYFLLISAFVCYWLTLPIKPQRLTRLYKTIINTDRYRSKNSSKYNFFLTTQYALFVSSVLLFSVLIFYFFNVNTIHYFKLTKFILLLFICAVLLQTKQVLITKNIMYISFFELFFINYISNNYFLKLKLLHMLIFFFTLSLAYYEYAYYFSVQNWIIAPMLSNNLNIVVSELWFDFTNIFFHDLNILTKNQLVIKNSYAINFNFATRNEFLRGYYIQPSLWLLNALFCILNFSILEFWVLKKKNFYFF